MSRPVASFCADLYHRSCPFRLESPLGPRGSTAPNAPEQAFESSPPGCKGGGVALKSRPRFFVDVFVRLARLCRLLGRLATVNFRAETSNGPFRARGPRRPGGSTPDPEVANRRCPATGGRRSPPPRWSRMSHASAGWASPLGCPAPPRAPATTSPSPPSPGAAPANILQEIEYPPLRAYRALPVTATSKFSSRPSKGVLAHPFHGACWHPC